MNLKLKISFIHIIVCIVTALFIYMIYDSYIESQKKDIELELTRILKLNENHMTNSLANIEKMLASKQEIVKNIHLHVHDILKKQQSPLTQIQNNLEKKFFLNSNKIDIEIFILDQTYTVIDSTHSKNIGLSLLHMKNSKKNLDSLTQIDQFIQTDDVAVDFLDYEVKSYSYSKLSDTKYLGIGTIYKESVEEKRSFSNMIDLANTRMNLFCVMQDSQNNQYYESLIQHKNSFSSNEEYYTKKQKFPLSQTSDDIIIKTNRQWSMQSYKDGDILSIFIPMIKAKNSTITIPGDIILQVDLDISSQNDFTDTIIYKLIFFILSHFLLVFIIFYFTNKYQKIDTELQSEVIRNQNLIEYNKQFISNLVHQIRTPLAITMTNISLLEVLNSKDIKSYVSQINASINMLSNSYENLSYFVSFKNLNYQTRDVNISSFLQNRIAFFDQIALANQKNIIANIHSECIGHINDIELERMIDNNLSNALYFSQYKGTVIVSLQKTTNSKILLFKVMKHNSSKSIDILNDEKTNILKDMSSLGLGVYIIKHIVQKYNMKYSLKQENEKLLFKYEIFDKNMTKIV